jgi:dihydrofolate reductase
MRKVIVSNLVSLDGFMAGPGGEIDWFQVDREFESYAVDLARTVDTLLFGRVTYELMASYWPTATEMTDDRRIIEIMNSYPKIVFSKTLEKAEWNNSGIARESAVEAVAKLKQLKGMDMIVYGSGSIVSALAKADLIDDYRIFVSPTILGAGIPLFREMSGRIPLKLVHTKSFGTGLTVLSYTPAGPSTR